MTYWWFKTRYKNVIWWFRHRFDPRHRYNIIRTGLRPGYYDPDLRLIHAIFEETSRFIEHTEDVIDWRGSPEVLVAYKAAAEWWKVHKNTLFDYPYVEEVEWQECKQHMVAVIEHLRCMWYP